MGLSNGGYSCADCDDCEECVLLDPTPTVWGAAWTAATFAFNLSRSVTSLFNDIRTDLRVKHNLSVGTSEFRVAVSETIADL